MAKDWKSEYLYKAFASRTRNKKEECYVVNAIWQRLCLQGYEIEPITQKYVRRSDDKGHKFALIDLFFPALNLAIEVDEAYHDVKKDDDLERQKEVIRILLLEKGVKESKIGALEKVTASEIKPGKNMPEFLRIHTDVPYNKLEEQINNVVQEIKNKIHDPETIRWISPEEKMIQLRNKGAISTSDHIYFKTFNQICDIISPKNRQEGKGRFHTFVPLKNDPAKMLWCPQLALHSKNGDVKAAPDSGWVNELIDEETLREWHPDPGKLHGKNPNLWFPRVTFLKVKTALGEEGYRFVGIFERQPEDAPDGARIYKRTKTEYSWPTADA